MNNRYTKQQLLLIFVFFVVLPPILLLAVLPTVGQYIQSDTPKPLYNDAPPPKLQLTSTPGQPVSTYNIRAAVYNFTQTILP